MDGYNEKENNKTKEAFWKKDSKNVPGSIKPVYGAMHPPLKQDSKPNTPKRGDLHKVKHARNSSSASFKDFQESTEDAWNVDDDDILLETTGSSKLKISPQVAKSAALSVLNDHSKVPKMVAVPSSETRAAALQLLALQKESPVHHHHQHHSSTPPPLTSSPPPPSRAVIVQGPGIGIRQTALFIPPLSQKNTGPSATERDSLRLEKFHQLINGPTTNLEELRELSWPGIPSPVRAITWKLLSGYLPANAERRESTLERKRQEYFNYVEKYYHFRSEELHHETYRQIHIDVPRMSPLVPLFQQTRVQEAFERILYIWAIRHPASGYVQGMNDLVTPFFVVFLKDSLPPDADVENFNVSLLHSETLRCIEADSYWCLANLLDSIQDQYTFSQPGIQNKVKLLKELIQRIDAPLHEHLKRHSVEYLQFSFRWMNNLLMRELPLQCTIRLWDTYLAEVNGFSTFHLYVCAAFLIHWSHDLKNEKDFQGLMMLLQNLPTLHWGHEEIGLLVAEAYSLKYMFADAPNHLQPASIK